jgi:hypothetical protein
MQEKGRACNKRVRQANVQIYCVWFRGITQTISARTFSEKSLKFEVQNSN